MKDMQGSVEDFLLNKKNVVGVGIGQKWTNGRNTGDDAIVVFVSEKKSGSVLSKNDIIPSVIDGVKTDVIGRTGSFRSQSLVEKVRPIKPGYSCGHPKVTAGTIGGFFNDFNGNVVGLSNSHVLANAGIGAKRGDMIYQPGTYDGGGTNDYVGNLKYHRGLASSRGVAYNHADRIHVYGYNFEDSAVMSVDVDYDDEIPTIGFINDFREGDLDIGEMVQKTGRTTGFTSSNIIATNVTVSVDYGFDVLRFKDQIITGVMSQGGDSGSLGLDVDNNVIGLLFAGSNNATIFNRIRYPKASYGLTIINTVRIEESHQYYLTVDGSSTKIDFGKNEYGAAMEEVRRLAKEGHIASISMEYGANPIS